MSKKPLVVNLYGGPGCGKSTGAAHIFSELKKKGVNAELITEFAKDKTWEKNSVALNCQEYVFGKQSFRLQRCRDDVDVIVTDSPLPLTIIYNKNPALGQPFEQVVLSVFNTYNNINYLLKRVKPYNPKGRKQTESESIEIDGEVLNLLNKFNIVFFGVPGDDDGYNFIVDEVYDYLKHNNLLNKPVEEI